MKDHLPLKNENFYLIKNLKFLENLKNTEKGQLEAHKFINKTSRNYSPLRLHKALIRKENVFLGPSLNFPFFLILSIFHPLFFIPSVHFFSCTKKRQENDWGQSKGLHSGKASLEMLTASVLVSSKEKSPCPSFETTDATTFIPSYLQPALEYNLYVLNAQVFCNVNGGLMGKLYLCLYKFRYFIMFSGKQWMDTDLAQGLLSCWWGAFPFLPSF